MRSSAFDPAVRMALADFHRRSLSCFGKLFPIEILLSITRFDLFVNNFYMFYYAFAAWSLCAFVIENCIAKAVAIIITQHTQTKIL